MRADVVIVGGGPVGCMTAASIGKGFSTVVLEEHDEIGVPEQCAGLIAPRVVGMANADDAILNRIDGANVHFPDGRCLTLKGNEVKAYVVERRQFDERCLDMALASGAEYRKGERFVELSRTSDGISVRTDTGLHFDSLIGIGADGYKSMFGRTAGLPGPDEVVRGVQVDLSIKPENNDSVDVWIGKKVAPGFFAWSIPCGDFTRIGLCVSEGHQNPYTYLRKLLKDIGLDASPRLRTYSGVIPIGPSKKTYCDNILIVGDAAGQAKPLSGGGLFTGLTAAKIAGEISKKAVEANDATERTLRKYEARWRKEFGRELDRGMLVRRSYTRMDDRTLNDVGEVLDTEKCRAVLSEGDIDRPTEIARSVLKAAPGLMRFSPSLLTSLLPKRRAKDEMP